MKHYRLRIGVTVHYSVSSIICLTWTLENSSAPNSKGRKYLYTSIYVVVIMQKKVAIVYWPFSVYKEVHKYKDPGEIPRELSLLGYNTRLIVGKADFKANHEFEITETRNVEGNPIFLHIKELLFFIRLVNKYNTDISFFLTFYDSIVSLVSGIIVKLHNYFSNKNGSEEKVILKLDWDGNMREYSYFKKLYRVAKLMLASFIFDKIITETRCGYESLKFVPFLKKKLVIIPNGYAEEIYRPVDYSSERRENVILSVGRIARQKDYEVCIRAFNEVHKSHPDWVLKIVGEIEDKQYYIKLKELVRSLNLEDSVVFTEALPLDQLIKLYRSSRIYCSSSSYENSSISRIEASINGLPVVTTNSGCAIDVDGWFTVNIGDWKALASTIISLINDEQKAKISVKRAQSSLLSWKDVVQKMVRL